MSADRGDSGEGGAPGIAVAFVGGALTATVIALAFFVFLGARIGFKAIWERTGVAMTSMVLDMPGELVEEIGRLGGAIDNAGNPTNAPKHDTILVRPDVELGYVLRPGVSVDGYLIRAGDPMNLDPPVVFVATGAAMSAELRAYLAERTIVQNRYQVDAEGFRRTVPEVDAPRKILMVGDSGIFGVGLDDEDTVASALQRLVGRSRRVVNAGVAGYDAAQAFRVARKLVAAGDCEALVYVAHINDFYEERHLASVEKARRIAEDFASLGPAVRGPIALALLTTLEYEADDMLGSLGWRRERIEAVDRLRRELPAIAGAAGLAYVEWSDVVAAVREREKTVFAPWSLYADHAHLAPRAAHLFAERIRAALPDFAAGE